jgi:RNA polymerase-binding transcription factor DksA
MGQLKEWLLEKREREAGFAIEERERALLDQIEEEKVDPCDHSYDESGICEKCGDVDEPLDFSGATHGER